MSYAVESKKRKFNRVLESLSKPLSTDASPKPTNTAATAPERTSANLSIKKVRLSGGDSELASVHDTIRKVAKGSSRASSTSSITRPSFVPWDRERFLERLETFRRVDRWSPKPAAVNEVACAKRGWICTDVMRVTCVGGCGGSVVVKLPDEIDELDGYDSEKVQERKEVRAKLVEEYARLLIEGHGANCPWRGKGCDATIHRLPLTNPDVAISNFQKRYLNLAKMGDKLPTEEIIETPEGFDMEGIIKMLPGEVLQDPAEHVKRLEPETAPAGEDQEDGTTPAPQNDLTINRAAFALAFFGWDTVSNGTAGLAGCSACFRRLGLWMYKPKDNGDATVYNSLDVANEHMEYCPWINGQAQSGTGKSTEKVEELRSGWELLAQAIRVKHRRHIRSTASMDTLRPDVDTESRDGSVVDEEAQKASDKEWWARLRRMRQVLTVRSPKKTKSIAPKQ